MSSTFPQYDTDIKITGDRKMVEAGAILAERVRDWANATPSRIPQDVFDALLNYDHVRVNLGR